MRAIPIFALVSIFTGFNIEAILGQAKEPAPVFRPALQEIKSQTQIPILLPSRLPSHIREADIKLAAGDVRKDGYFIALYWEDIGSNSSYAAGFGGSKRVFEDLPNTRRVTLAGGVIAMFRPVSCGGSCAPANLWWEQNGVMYNIQIKLGSTSNEKDQERILVETANSCVAVRP